MFVSFRRIGVDSARVRYQLVATSSAASCDGKAAEPGMEMGGWRWGKVLMKVFSRASEIAFRFELTDNMITKYCFFPKDCAQKSKKRCQMCPENAGNLC